jgi:hypothetical protein
MPSPIATEKGHHIYRREHIDSTTSLPERLPIVTPASFFRTDAALSQIDGTTLFEKRRPFLHGPTNRYKFDALTFGAFRVMMSDLIAHWRGGPRVEDVIHSFVRQSSYVPLFRAYRSRPECPRFYYVVSPSIVFRLGSFSRLELHYGHDMNVHTVVRSLLKSFDTLNRQ